MNIKKNLCASICVNVLIFGIFLLLLQQLDVFTQLLFSFAPIVISILVTILINRDHDPERNNYLQCAMICAAINFIYLVAAYICISTIKDVNDIYEVSKKYNTGYVTISENNSPILSIIIFSIASLVFHYFVMQKTSAKKLNKC